MLPHNTEVFVKIPAYSYLRMLIRYFVYDEIKSLMIYIDDVHKYYTYSIDCEVYNEMNMFHEGIVYLQYTHIAPLHLMGLLTALLTIRKYLVKLGNLGINIIWRDK